MTATRSVPAAARHSVALLVAAWSDGEGYAAAVDLAEAHHSLLPRPVSPAQLNGLRNIVSGAPGPSAVRAFIEHQAQKASRHENTELRNYWQALGKALSGLRETAVRLLQVTGTAAPQAVDALHLRLMAILVQHLVIHSLYLAGGARRGS